MGTSTRTSGSPRSAPETRMPASIRAGRPQNTDATALPPNGGHPITIVVADDTSFVEHPGNAGRPHVADRPQHQVCTGPRVRQGRTSSLRSGRSTLTNACGPEPSAHRRPCPATLTQVTRAQIERTQIVRSRPDRTRGEPVERERGAGDLSSLTCTWTPTESAFRVRRVRANRVHQSSGRSRPRRRSGPSRWLR
jgi:hypothetical protein